MILYVNGSTETAAAKAVNNFNFANDDFAKVALGRKPHPDNLAVSWGMRLSKMMQLALVCDAETNSSNDRILRTTYDFIRNRLPLLESKLTYIVIGWTVWIREEWFDEESNEYIQIPVLDNDECPIKWKNKYNTFIKTVNHSEKQKHWDSEIWELHHLLKNLKIPHLFFNSVESLNPNYTKVRNWNQNYIDPYMLTFNNFTNNHGYYGSEIQNTWANFLFSQLTKHETNL